MKKYAYILCLLCWGILNAAGCGKKGDPVIPVIPQPMPVQELTATLNENAITLAWFPPAKYDTGETMKLKDIKNFTIFRSIDVLTTNEWDFSKTIQGWKSATSKTLPVKFHQGILRSASTDNALFVLSPPDLTITAANTRYIRLKLWAKNSDEGYLAFITDTDTSWDTNISALTFYPSVHTSYYAYLQAFSRIKIKAFPVMNAFAGDNKLYDYVVDMGSLPAWKGRITQIGILLRNPKPQETITELGVVRVKVSDVPEEPASLYTSAPWIFLDDEEGWSVSPSTTAFGAAHGVLSARGSSAMTLLSPTGQNIQRENIAQVQLRMSVTAGDMAYLILRKGTDEPLKQLSTEMLSSLSAVVKIPLRPSAEFQTDTIPLPVKNIQEQSGNITQIALFFPESAEKSSRHIAIDYIDLQPKNAETPSLLAQQDLPTIAEIEQTIRQRMQQQFPQLSQAYNAIPEKQAEPQETAVKIAEISPKDPAPASFEDGKFSLIDQGSAASPLLYGERYTYQIEMTDRKNRTTARSNGLTIAYTRTPMPPDNLKAEPGNQLITLQWTPPFLTTDGKKLQTLEEFRIFRATTSGEYPEIPIARIAANITSFTDKNLSNQVTYFYKIQSVASSVPTPNVSLLSSEVSAEPIDVTPPDAPTGVKAMYSDNNTVHLFWNPVQAADFAGFNVYRSDRADAGFQKINEQPVLKASYLDATVTANLRYYYRVTAIDGETPPNESDVSESAFIETILIK